MPTFREIAKDERYHIYLWGAEMLARYAKRFERHVSRRDIQERLKWYGVMMKAVDLATDDGKQSMETYCRVLEHPHEFDKNDTASIFASHFSKITKLTKQQLDDFYVAASESKREKSATNIGGYLNARKEVTRGLVKIGIASIRNFIVNEKFNAFFYRLLHAVDLFDCAYDLDDDIARGEIQFRVGLLSRVKIYLRTTYYFVILMLRYPFLWRDFVRFSKILDKVHY